MPTREARAFAVDLDAFAAKVKVDVSVVRRKVAIDLHTKITERTPVDTGRLKNSWNVADDVADITVPPEGPQSGTGRITALFERPFEPTWITSNLPYAEAIEFGHSGQAPSGMVRVSVAEIEAELLSILEL